jgi:hypothetical protein
LTNREQAEIQLFLRGTAANVPLWFLLLDVADGDPIKAAAIEENIDQEWWERLQIYRSEVSKFQKEQQAKAKHGRK